MPRVGELGRAARAVCFYIDPGGIQSVLDGIDMPRVPSEGDGLMNLRAEVGKAMEVVAAKERRRTRNNATAKDNTLTRRFSAYLKMREAKNILADRERKLEVAYEWLQLSTRPFPEEAIAETEEELADLREWLGHWSRENNRLRKSSLYLELISVLEEELERRKIWL